MLGGHQQIKGDILLLCKGRVPELYQPPRAFGLKYLEEMALTAEALYREQMSYELPGNGDTHVHEHLFSVSATIRLGKSRYGGGRPKRCGMTATGDAEGAGQYT